MILQLIKSRVICYLDGKQYEFENGLLAYEQLGKENHIVSISAFNNQVIVELSHINDNHWKEEYVQQFGEEPNFF